MMSPKILLVLIVSSLHFVILAGAQDPSTELRRHVRRGDFRDAETLLGNPNVDPDAQDGRGFTALMFAAEGDTPELVTLLLKAGVDFDLQNRDGETALIVAVKRGRVDASRLLLMSGADISIRDTDGFAALDWARRRDRTYLALIIAIASRPSAAKVILSEQPVTRGTEHLELPRVIEDTPPLYTEGAFDRGIEGRVVLRVIIQKDGSVGAIRVRESLDGDLDRAAIAAVANWQFEPATIDGEPINVLADIEVDFQIEQEM
jgi:TonB family protein